MPRGFCSTFAASTLHDMLLHPNTLQNPPPFFTQLLPVTVPPRPHPCISRCGARPTLQLPLTHPTHARMIFTHYCPTLLSLCHNSVIFLPPAFQIPSSQKCDQLFSHSPRTHLARQYTLLTLRGPLPQAYLCKILSTLPSFIRRPFPASPPHPRPYPVPSCSLAQEYPHNPHIPPCASKNPATTLLTLGTFY